MKKEVLGVLIVTVLLFMGSCKSSQQGQNNDNNGRKGERQGRPSVEELFEKMDTNEDGLISKKEVKGRLSEGFDEIDSDGDGFLTEEELNNAPKPERQQGGMQSGGRSR